MKVSWNAAEAPPGYSPLGRNVIFVARPDGYERLQYPVHIDDEGTRSYGWQDTIFGSELTFVVVLPPGHVVLAGDTRPPAAVSKVFQDRLAVCWQVRGKHQTKARIHWKIRPAEGSIAKLSGELNEELRHRHDSYLKALPVRNRRRILVGSLIVILALIGLGIVRHFVFGGSQIYLARSSPGHYERNDKKERVIVFVHGLFGDSTSTWTSANGSYWPRMLLSDHAFDDSDVYVASYDTPYAGNRMTIDEIVASLDNRLEYDHVFVHRDVVFVVHSLGGLVVQRFLLTHREHAKQVSFIYFFSTPETGAQVAKVGSLFSEDPLLREMFPGEENDYLQNLEMEWITADFGSIRRYCAYEKQPTNGILVVDRLSGTRNCNKVLPLNESHINIVKPSSPQDDAYVALLNAVTGNPAPSPASAKWTWIDPINPPDFATTLGKILTGADSPLTALEWDELKGQRKQELPAQWIVFGSPEFNPAHAPAMALLRAASAKMVGFVQNRDRDDWHTIERTGLSTALHCQNCASMTGRIRFVILVFPLDRRSFDLVMNKKGVPEQLFQAQMN